MTAAPATFPDIRATDYHSFVAGWRAIKEHLGLSDSELDDLAGLASGHTGKCLGPSRERGIGAVALDGFLNGLPIDLKFVVNPEKLARFQAGGIRKRAETHVRLSHPRISKDAVRRIMGELGRKSMASLFADGRQAWISSKGGRSRAQSLSPKRRQAIARK